MACERCGEKKRAVTTSFYDLAWICIKCFYIEGEYRSYDRARNAALDAGNGDLQLRMAI